MMVDKGLDLQESEKEAYESYRVDGKFKLNLKY